MMMWHSLTIKSSNKLMKSQNLLEKIACFKKNMERKKFLNTIITLNHMKIK